jgi:hypothetical protein
VIRFLDRTLTNWVKYQEYWLQAEREHRSDALFIHYEDMCAGAAVMLKPILRFAHFKSDSHADKRFKCTTSLLPCSASPATGYVVPTGFCRHGERRLTSHTHIQVQTFFQHAEPTLARTRACRTRYPEHLDMYTPQQINAVFKATAQVMRKLGYRVVGRGKSTRVMVDEAALDEANLLHVHNYLGMKK